MDRVSDGTLRWAIRRLNGDIARYEDSTFLAQYGSDTLRAFEQIAHEVQERRMRRCETCDMRKWDGTDDRCLVWRDYIPVDPREYSCDEWRAKGADDGVD